MSAVVLLLSVLSASPPPVPHEQHEQSMVEARAAYDAFDLQHAERGFAQAAATATTPQQRATALVWLGALAADNGDFEGAKARFRDAVDADVTVLVPSQLSPTIQQLVEAARAEQKAALAASAAGTAVDEPLPERPRWALISGGAVTMLGVLAVGGGAMVGMQAITQRDVAQSLEFQDDAVDEYRKSRDGALWANVLYGAGGVLVATGGTLVAASFMGADQ